MPTVRCGLSFTLRCLDLTAFLPARPLLHSWLEAPEKGVSVLVSHWMGRAGETFSSLWEPEGGGKMKLAHHFHLSNRRPNAQLFTGAV